jgi:hypothetical protein
MAAVSDYLNSDGKAKQLMAKLGQAGVTQENFN